jgi:hypothetical protein
VFGSLSASELAQSAPEDLPRDPELVDLLESLRKRTRV